MVTVIERSTKPIPHGITALLREWSRGSTDALHEMLPLVYNHLRETARRHLRREAANLTLQTAELVNEVYLRLAHSKRLSFENRERFFYFAGRMMRHILTEHARKRLSLKRGSGNPALSLEEPIELSSGEKLSLSTLLGLDEALNGLARVDPRQSLIIELRFFAGMKKEEIAEVLGISARTVGRDWEMARRWLYRELSKKSPRAIKG